MMMTNPHGQKQHHRLTTLLALVAFVFVGSACGTSGSGDDADTGTPVAEFSQDRTTGGPGLMVQFSDESDGDIDSWAWDFGAAGTSDEQNPLVQFDAVGLYTVELVVTGPGGRSTIIKDDLIEVLDAGGAGVASFTSTQRTGGPGMTVTFTNTSAGDLTSTEWTFTLPREAPDPDLVITSSERDPVIVFEELGQYDVLLEVAGSAGDGAREIPDYVQVLAPADNGVAAFTADRTTGGPGMTVAFENTSAGIASSTAWDFGAAGTSTDADPIVVFDDVGTYTVRLTIDGSLGESTQEEVDFITVVEASEAGIADFSVSNANPAVGEEVTFTDLSTVPAASHSWTFTRDPGEASELVLTSTDANPAITFLEAGVYDVELTVTGAGGQSTEVKEGFVRAFAAPIASFSCDPAVAIFVPATRTCTDTSTDTLTTLWTFEADSPTADDFQCFVTEDAAFVPPAGVEACADASPSFTWNLEGDFDVTIEAFGPGGASDTQTQTFSAAVLEINDNSAPSGTLPAPADVRFRARTNGVAANFIFWTIDQLDLDSANQDNPLDFTLRNPGTYTVTLLAQQSNPIDGIITTSSVTLDYVVLHGPPGAEFSAENNVGSGPLEVQFTDESTGEVNEWVWDFGDGESCFFAEDPETTEVDGVETNCGSESPTHEYAVSGPYDVSLTAKGPEFEDDEEFIDSVRTQQNLVHVSVVDPSFELQTADAGIGGQWTSLRPGDATEVATHIALDEAGGADIGMPSDGEKWAALDGLGTTGLDDVDEIENGIQQEIYFPEGLPVLEFDYTFLYSEPPAAITFDSVAATVSDGVTTVVIDSSVADTATAYAGQSLRFPTRDGLNVRSTPIHTASIDLQDAFPGTDHLTPFTLTIRTTNANNGLRSPRAYVDNVRFTEVAGALPAEFTLDTDPVFEGVSAQFSDQTCAEPEDACDPPTSWRWDFDTHTAPTPPTASGSGEQNPSYVFEEAGVYDVELLVRRGDVESVANLSVTVIENPEAAFDLVTAGPFTAPASLEFDDASTANALDPIVAWDWDFGGWGTSTDQNPDPVDILQAGTYTVTLTITTASGVVESASLDVTID